jgi:hypothetical protein
VDADGTRLFSPNPLPPPPCGTTPFPNVIFATLLARNPSPVCDAPPWHHRAGGNQSAAVAHSFSPREGGEMRVRRRTEVVPVTKRHGR